MPRLACVLLVLLVTSTSWSAEKTPLETALSREIIGPHLSLAEVKEYCASRVLPVPMFDKAEDWTKYAEATRQRVLENVVFRGEAAKWRDAKTEVVWQETIDGGPGYRIKKLRYEALPGLWIPALLYEPEKLDGKRPLSLNVNGHDSAGKAAGYKQIRCINLAKRGLLVLNVEWLGMGQLRTPGNGHTKLNQLDLCGTSGVGVFFLAMQRGIDVLLSHPNADPNRIAVAGLSGGGWQTIFLSSLDPRVTLSNPVAGYSSFVTRTEQHPDLGDSEQTPVDLGMTADYKMLTAMRAPRPTLLTFNANDKCCFKADTALPPLMDAASPVFKLLGRSEALRSHINEVPGTHNFERDNREAFYRMVGDFFYANEKFDATEIESASEVKKSDQLKVEMPEVNQDLHSLAMSLAEKLPRNATPPSDKDAAKKWHSETREQLAKIVRAKPLNLAAQQDSQDKLGEREVTYWRFRIADSWTVPAVEIAPASPKGSTLLIADAGRAKSSAAVERLLAAGQRVVAVDPFYFGESKIEQKDWLHALMISTIGERPLGVQAGQVASVARWLGERTKSPVAVASEGPRSSVIALVAASLEPKQIASLDVSNPLGSLKESLENDQSVTSNPELFCFGLLELVDMPQLVALASPRSITVRAPSDRARQEVAKVQSWITAHGGALAIEAGE